MMVQLARRSMTRIAMRLGCFRLTAIRVGTIHSVRASSPKNTGTSDSVVIGHLRRRSLALLQRAQARQDWSAQKAPIQTLILTGAPRASSPGSRSRLLLRHKADFDCLG